MKIASKIKPRNQKARTVDLFGRRYVFAATLDKDGYAHFVADVTIEKHAHQFLSTGDYYHFGADLEPKASLKAPVAPPPATNDEQDGEKGGEKGGTGEVPADARLGAYSAETQAEAKALLAGSATQISGALGQVTDLDIVRAALLIEQESATPRKNVTQLLTSTLEMAKQANVPGA